LFFEAFSRNKRSLALDLGKPAGREVFEDLVRVSDVVYSNWRGDVPAKLRIRYEDLCRVNRRIVCCSLSGFGTTGPRADEPGYDYVLQALAGWMSLTGEPDGPPAKSALSLVDYSGGLAAGISLLAAVHAARRDGRGMDCDVSLYDTAIGMLTYLATWNLNGGFEPVRTRHSAHPSIVAHLAAIIAAARSSTKTPTTSWVSCFATSRRGGPRWRPRAPSAEGRAAPILGWD
jgi:crotonobetainyl-CoA:carnitine CoA-transferase CaiB-like acyl-CoA transferase